MMRRRGCSNPNAKGRPRVDHFGSHRCRLVIREQRGRFAYYRLADERVEALLALGGELSSGSVGPDCCPVCGSQPW